MAPRSWIVAGVLAALVGFGVLFGARLWRTPEYQKPGVEKPATQDSETAKPSDNSRSSAKSAPSPKDTVKALVRAWNQGDTARLADLFASDGVLVIPAGSQIESRAQIEKTMREKRAGLLKDTRLTNTVEDVTQVDGENTTIRGSYRLDGIKIFGFDQSAAGTYVLHQVKHGERWLIARAEVTNGG